MLWEQMFFFRCFGIILTESIFRSIGPLDDFFHGRELHDLHDGSENFFFSNRHTISNIREHCWLDEVPTLTVSVT